MIDFSEYSKINESLAKTEKAVIGIGCSFVAGMGAWPTEIFENYDVTVDESKGNRCVIADKNQEQEVKQTYNLNTVFGDVNFSELEKKHAFTNVLASKYLQDEYTPINLGQSGNGNRSSISNLFLHPSINWDKIKGGVIVYCPSGKERFDFANDEGVDHGFNFITMWPGRSEKKQGKEYTREDMAGGYGASIYSEKFTTLEQISYAQMIMQFAKLHNMHVVITPGFDERYSEKHFTESLNEKIKRDQNGRRIFSSESANAQRANDLVSSFPWINMFKPQGMDTFINLCLKQENYLLSKNASYFFDYLHKGSKNWWISPCAHPTAKGHDLFAEELFKHLQEKQYV